MVLFTLGNSSDAFLVLRAQHAGAAVLEILGMIAVFNLVYALAAPPAGRLSDRIDRRRIILIGWALYALVYLGFAGASQTWHLWGLYMLYGLYYGLTEGVAKAVVSDLVAPASRGTAFGIYNAAIGIAALPASLAAGVLWQRTNPTVPFLFGGVLASLAAVLLWAWVRPPATAPA
jgi:MFS family permease